MAAKTKKPLSPAGLSVKASRKQLLIAVEVILSAHKSKTMSLSTPTYNVGALLHETAKACGCCECFRQLAWWLEATVRYMPHSDDRIAMISFLKCYRQRTCTPPKPNGTNGAAQEYPACLAS